MNDTGIQIMREPKVRERVSDAPQRLRELTDIAKGEAIAAGIQNVVGLAFTGKIAAVRYRAIGRLPEFQCPAEIRLTVTPLNADDCDGVKKAADLQLENAISDSLSRAAGEKYRVRIADKSYNRYDAGVRSMRLAVQVGTDRGGSNC